MCSSLCWSSCAAACASTLFCGACRMDERMDSDSEAVVVVVAVAEETEEVEGAEGVEEGSTVV